MITRKETIQGNVLHIRASTGAIKHFTVSCNGIAVQTSVGTREAADEVFDAAKRRIMGGACVRCFCRGTNPYGEEEEPHHG
ncbi:MAG: hypothetical protein JRI80_00450 [Deltaproteobacteria bacterium]|nr:hypothetical protein [Deltaproteobacteria bacterium]